jgi:hypothetical protein
VWVTAEAIMALDGRPLPIAAPARSVPRSMAPAAHHPSTIPAHHRSPTAHHRRHHVQSTRRRSHSGDGASAGGAMRYLGLIDALVLAPVGLG